MIPVALAATLVVMSPVLSEPGPLRLAASSEAGPVTWSLDGLEAGTSEPGHALTVDAAAGAHTVVATSASATPGWRAIVRPDAKAGHAGGAAWVPSWMGEARAVPQAPRDGPGGFWASSFLVAAAAAIVVVQRRRR